MKNKNVKVMTSSDKTTWCTPQNLFEKIVQSYGPFDLDAAADETRSKCNAYLDESINALKVDWHQRNCKWQDFTIPNPNTFSNNNIFLNPPYGRGIGKWTKKAYEESQKGCRIVTLVPSRTGSTWFQEAAKVATEIVFLKGRVVFESSPGVPVLDKHGKPMPAPFDSTLIVFEKPWGQHPKITWWNWKK